jgi:hypothetical protein
MRRLIAAACSLMIADMLGAESCRHVIIYSMIDIHAALSYLYIAKHSREQHERNQV